MMNLLSKSKVKGSKEESSLQKKSDTKDLTRKEMHISKSRDESVAQADMKDNIKYHRNIEKYESNFSHKDEKQQVKYVTKRKDINLTKRTKESGKHSSDTSYTKLYKTVQTDRDAYKQNKNYASDKFREVQYKKRNYYTDNSSHKESSSRSSKSSDINTPAKYNKNIERKSSKRQRDSEEESCDNTYKKVCYKPLAKTSKEYTVEKTSKKRKRSRSETSSDSSTDSSDENSSNSSKSNKKEREKKYRQLKEAKKARARQAYKILKQMIKGKIKQKNNKKDSDSEAEQNVKTHDHKSGVKSKTKKVKREQVTESSKTKEKVSCNSIKSVVKVKSPGNKKEIDDFDLRSKLTPKNFSQFFSRLRNYEQGFSESSKSKNHDNLVITVPNDQEPKKSNNENAIIKTAEIKKGKKLKKVQLVINVVCESSQSSSSDDDANEKMENTLTQEDLSFLDDFNIDDIVGCLTSTDKDTMLDADKISDIIHLVSDDNISNASTVILEEVDDGKEQQQIKQEEPTYSEKNNTIHETERTLTTTPNVNTNLSMIETVKSIKTENENKIPGELLKSEEIKKEIDTEIEDGDPQIRLNQNSISEEENITPVENIKEEPFSGEVNSDLQTILDKNGNKVTQNSNNQTIKDVNIEFSAAITEDKAPVEIKEEPMNEHQDNIFNNSSVSDLNVKLGNIFEKDVKKIESESEIELSNKVFLGTYWSLGLDIKEESIEQIQSYIENSEESSNDEKCKEQIDTNISITDKVKDTPKHTDKNVLLNNPTEVRDTIKVDDSASVKKSSPQLKILAGRKNDVVNMHNNNTNTKSSASDMKTKDNSVQRDANSNMCASVTTNKSKAKPEQDTKHTMPVKDEKELITTTDTIKTTVEDLEPKDNVVVAENKPLAKDINDKSIEDLCLSNKNDKGLCGKETESTKNVKDTKLMLPEDEKLPEEAIENICRKDVTESHQTTKTQITVAERGAEGSPTTSKGHTIITSPVAQNVERKEKAFVHQLEYKLISVCCDQFGVVSKIHTGKFSDVYLCKDSNSESFAVKVLKNFSFSKYMSKVRGGMMKQIQKDIPKENLTFLYVFKSFVVFNQWCYLMEYYPKNLEEALAENTKPFHINHVKWLARQLVSALIVLRDKSIVHSDIKPSHILLNCSNNRLKLCGFDGAFYIKNNKLLSPKIGTVNYRAPEVILGYFAGFPIDIWSTALVLYEMATKRQLFPGKHNNHVLFMIICTLDNIPKEMVQRGRYGVEHFRGAMFMKKFSSKFGDYKMIHEAQIMKNNILLASIQNTVSLFVPFNDAGQRETYMRKLSSFHQMLRKMLLVHPHERVLIEFIYTDPFLFDIVNS